MRIDSISPQISSFVCLRRCVLDRMRVVGGPGMEGEGGGNGRSAQMAKCSSALIPSPTTPVEKNGKSISWHFHTQF